MLTLMKVLIVTLKYNNYYLLNCGNRMCMDVQLYACTCVHICEHACACVHICAHVRTCMHAHVTQDVCTCALLACFYKLFPHTANIHYFRTTIQNVSQ